MLGISILLDYEVFVWTLLASLNTTMVVFKMETAKKVVDDPNVQWPVDGWLSSAWLTLWYTPN